LNAYVSGFGSTRRIVLYDTVLDRLPDAQIESIVAHELGHVATDDVLSGTLIGALGAGAGAAALGWLLTSPVLLRRAGADGPADPRVVPLLLFLLAVGTLLSTPVQNVVSRHVEERADVQALDLTRDPAAFSDLQRDLAGANLSDPDPPAAWHWIFGSHPTVAQRLAMADDWARLERP
jgi:STE24 endopeptidase